MLELAQRLREDGVDCTIDRYIAAPAQGCGRRWVAEQIEQSDFVVCICSKAYRTSFEGKNSPEKGLGVNQEGYLIQQDLYDGW